ncbi:hypothetical protein ES702_04043 [subsurface metagenome]
MDKKAILASEVKNLNRRVLTISEKYPELNVNPTTKNMYLAYVKQMKTIFPEDEEVKKLSEEISGPFTYVDLSNLMGQLLALLNLLLR